MTKAILIQGCKDCPYRQRIICAHGKMFEVNPDSTTPHPDCKLNDLPTQKEIHKGIEDSCNTLQGSKETRESRTSLNEAKKWNGIGFVDGVKWTIEQITK